MILKIVLIYGLLNTDGLFERSRMLITVKNLQS